jgi:purine-binding chemotaxis protein CheW
LLDALRLYGDVARRKSLATRVIGSFAGYLRGSVMRDPVQETQTCCTFYLDGHCYGVPVERVQEVLRQEEMTHVPLAPREIRGLINLRGQIVTVIDLRTRLNLTDGDEDSGKTHVIVRCNGQVLSFLVDFLGDVCDVEAAQFELPPETLHGVARELIVGTYKMPRDLLIVLDVDKVAGGRGGWETL